MHKLLCAMILASVAALNGISQEQLASQLHDAITNENPELLQSTLALYEQNNISLNITKPLTTLAKNWRARSAIVFCIGAMGALGSLTLVATNTLALVRKPTHIFRHYQLARTNRLTQTRQVFEYKLDNYFSQTEKTVFTAITATTVLSSALAYWLTKKSCNAHEITYFKMTTMLLNSKAAQPLIMDQITPPVTQLISLARAHKDG